jgi:release factor glutamine methyltransferase
MSTVAQALRGAAHSLREHSDSPRLDAELLLGQVLGLSRPGLASRADAPLPPASLRSYADLVERRARGTPVAYLTGTREFWSLPLRVTPAVLVPRPETELLVELALRHLQPDEPRSVLDLGTGSGAIALAIASERPRATITAVDICPGALEVAIDNARRLGQPGIEWCLGRWFEPVAGRRFDAILANPPYIAAAHPALAKLAAEPAIALCDGPTGLESLTAIAQTAAQHLHAGGVLLLEHGDEQAPQVACLLERHGFTRVSSHPDLSGRPRVTLGIIHSPSRGTS